MARLILSLDGQVLAEYNMTKERYTVGRLPDNDVRIDNAAVSGHHGLIINISTTRSSRTQQQQATTSAS
jgi:pSer/pThr/pTyr-binding forkhead associated (FHA) protein